MNNGLCTVFFLLSITTAASCAMEEEPLRSGDDERSDRGDGLATIISDASNWVALSGIEHSGDTTVVNRIGDQTTVESDIITLAPGDATSFKLNLEQTNLIFQAPGLRFSIGYRTAGSSDDYVFIGWKVPDSYTIAVRSSMWDPFECVYEYEEDAVGSRAFRSITTNHPYPGVATVEVGLGCSTTRLEEKIVPMADLSGLSNTSENEFLVFVLPVDSANDIAETGTNYGYRLTALCDGGPCTQ